MCSSLEDIARVVYGLQQIHPLKMFYVLWFESDSVPAVETLFTAISIVDISGPHIIVSSLAYKLVTLASDPRRL
jgi:hypothetical protein